MHDKKGNLSLDLLVVDHGFTNGQSTIDTKATFPVESRSSCRAAYRLFRVAEVEMGRSSCCVRRDWRPSFQFGEDEDC